MSRAWLVANSIMKRSVTIVILAFASIFSACEERQVACTEEFRTVGIRVTGAELTEHFTIRTATSDTIRHDHTGGFPDMNYYLVLTDNYRSNFAGRRESFRFIGILGSVVKVDELFVIEADQCHIQYISGTMEVTI